MSSCDAIFDNLIIFLFLGGGKWEETISNNHFHKQLIRPPVTEDISFVLLTHVKLKHTLAQIFSPLETSGVSFELKQEIKISWEGFVERC